MFNKPPSSGGAFQNSAFGGGASGGFGKSSNSNASGGFGSGQSSFGGGFGGSTSGGFGGAKTSGGFGSGEKTTGGFGSSAGGFGGSSKSGGFGTSGGGFGNTQSSGSFGSSGGFGNNKSNGSFGSGGNSGFGSSNTTTSGFGSNNAGGNTSKGFGGGGGFGNKGFGNNSSGGGGFGGGFGSSNNNNNSNKGFSSFNNNSNNNNSNNSNSGGFISKGSSFNNSSSSKPSTRGTADGSGAIGVSASASSKPAALDLSVMPADAFLSASPEAHDADLIDILPLFSSCPLTDIVSSIAWSLKSVFMSVTSMDCIARIIKFDESNTPSFYYATQRASPVLCSSFIKHLHMCIGCGDGEVACIDLASKSVKTVGYHLSPVFYVRTLDEHAVSVDWSGEIALWSLSKENTKLTSFQLPSKPTHVEYLLKMHTMIVFSKNRKISIIQVNMQNNTIQLTQQISSPIQTMPKKLSISQKTSNLTILGVDGQYAVLSLENFNVVSVGALPYLVTSADMRTNLAFFGKSDGFFDIYDLDKKAVLTTKCISQNDAVQFLSLSTKDTMAIATNIDITNPYSFQYNSQLNPNKKFKLFLLSLDQVLKVE